MSKPCPICGRLTDDSYAFCRYCGHPLSANTAARPAPDLPVTEEQTPQTPEAKPDPVRRERNIPGLLIGIGAVAVILCIAFVLLYAFFSGSELTG